MVLLDSKYRVHVNITYSSTAAAGSAASAMNNAMTNLGRPEMCTINGSVVDLLVDNIETEAEAITIRDGIKSSWSGQTRTGGKAAVARTNA